MRKCLACERPYAVEDERCPSCGQRIRRERGVALFAPDPAGGGGFEESYFADLAAAEAGNFWFRARNRLILWALGAYAPGFGSLLEIGCGTGFVLSGIASGFPKARLHGSELYASGLAFARERLPSADFMQMDARAIPYVGEFEVVGAFDVLEHIEEDARVLEQIHGALRPGGVLLLTVPQHAWLWSPLDESARHARRYGKADLHAKLEAAGFKVARSTSFVSALLPFMFLSRLGARRRPPEHAHGLPEVAIHPWLDRAFALAMALDIALIRAGLSLPAGGSRMVVAAKAGAPGAPSAPAARTAHGA
jgi:SAM-dependent methyltransferase